MGGILTVDTVMVVIYMSNKPYFCKKKIV